MIIFNDENDKREQEIFEYTENWSPKDKKSKSSSQSQNNTYLTIEDVREKLNSTKDTFYICFDDISNDIEEKLRFLYQIDTQSTSKTTEKLSQLPDEDVKFLNNFVNLFDKDNPDRYKLLRRLIYIYENEVRDYDNHTKIPVSQNKKLLEKSFDIFKSLENSDIFLNKIFAYEKEGTKRYIYGAPVSDILLNEHTLLSFLLDYLKSENTENNQIIKNFFPNINNQR
ncbi:hypothetical protein HDR59_05275 [bacterium]|nr:hypothetical protein [bacterium]